MELFDSKILLYELFGTVQKFSLPCGSSSAKGMLLKSLYNVVFSIRIDKLSVMDENDKHEAQKTNFTIGTASSVKT